ncbi:acetyltransferase, GNAT family protein [Pseudoalteromonas sp. BSi20652]|uniref:GNAT family N-acetyltransferase n=1 Tax=Pseudoalteromonas sp. BSi20652 TaxID=388384 RepID=UPI000231A619|nr:GNAT family N-acetyltransferase [Pseudoalteromonas sp. BSi20652]GAA59552.1 acetyltransferase, GNAT family protein [Pseudoalteromonas sp. BSi20652]
MFTQKIRKTNKVVLEPLNHEHLEGLYKAGQHPKIWEWVLSNYTKTPELLKEWFTTSAQFNEQEQIVFAIIDVASKEIVGTSRLFRLDTHNLSAEIGHTFISDNWQRTYINTHSKYLLLSYAFDVLGLVRITFNTHKQNQKSRNAITRLGARFEGIAYKDRLLSNGSYRSTAKFSIIDEHWQSIKLQLEEKL